MGRLTCAATSQESAETSERRGQMPQPLRDRACPHRSPDFCPEGVKE